MPTWYGEVRCRARACAAIRSWARRVSNLRPLACEASALPLSYAPQGWRHCRTAAGLTPCGSARAVPRPPPARRQGERGAPAARSPSGSVGGLAQQRRVGKGEARRVRQSGGCAPHVEPPVAARGRRVPAFAPGSPRGGTTRASRSPLGIKNTSHFRSRAASCAACSPARPASIASPPVASPAPLSASTRSCTRRARTAKSTTARAVAMSRRMVAVRRAEGRGRGASPEVVRGRLAPSRIFVCILGGGDSTLGADVDARQDVDEGQGGLPSS